MKYRLKSYEIAPPGQYPYEQTEGIHRKFPSQPLIEAQAQIVSSFRKANGLARSSIAESLQDVDRYQCLRLGNMPQWCTPVDSPAVVAIGQTSPLINPPCQGCGAPVQQ